MAWNNGYETRKFIKEWKKREAEYRALGMNESQIKEIFKFDMEEFRSERTYRRHTQPLETCVFEEDDNDESDNALLQKFIDVLSYNAEIDDCMGTRYWWIDLIEDLKIVGIINTLPKIDIELITLIVFEGYSQINAAKILQISDRAVRAHWSKIKDLFVNVL